MSKSIVYAVAFAAALLTVLGTRVLIPALELMYYSALKSWEPAEPDAVLTPVADVSKSIEQRQEQSANQTNEDKAPASKPAATAKPRTTRKRAARKPAAKSTALAAVEALA